MTLETSGAVACPMVSCCRMAKTPPAAGLLRQRPVSQNRRRLVSASLGQTALVWLAASVILQAATSTNAVYLSTIATAASAWLPPLDLASWQGCPTAVDFTAVWDLGLLRRRVVAAASSRMTLRDGGVFNDCRRCTAGLLAFAAPIRLQMSSRPSAEAPRYRPEMCQGRCVSALFGRTRQTPLGSRDSSHDTQVYRYSNSVGPRIARSGVSPSSCQRRKGLANRHAQSAQRPQQSGLRSLQMMPIGIPKVPYRLPGSPTADWVDIYNRLYRERIIFLGQELDNELTNQLIGVMLYLDSEDTSKPIYVYINCPGGSVISGLALYDTMQHVRSDVVTINVGIAASMASFILAGGRKGKRFALPHSRVMIHQPMGGAQGQAEDIKVEAAQIMKTKNNIVDMYSSMTGQPREVVEKDIDRDNFMSAEEAKAYGLVDHIIELKEESSG